MKIIVTQSQKNDIVNLKPWIVNKIHSKYKIINKNFKKIKKNSKKKANK